MGLGYCLDTLILVDLCFILPIRNLNTALKVLSFDLAGEPMRPEAWLDEDQAFFVSQDLRMFLKSRVCS
jgi:hypothetical protein